MYDPSQLMRGTLEGCILKIIGLRETYGYEIVSTLQHFGFSEVKEGTIYPLLMRLENKRMVQSRFCQSPLGPSRKYYTITDEGRMQLRDFAEYWDSLSGIVGKILAEREE